MPTTFLQLFFLRGHNHFYDKIFHNETPPARALVAILNEEQGGKNIQDIVPIVSHLGAAQEIGQYFRVVDAKNPPFRKQSRYNMCAKLASVVVVLVDKKDWQTSDKHASGSFYLLLKASRLVIVSCYSFFFFTVDGVRKLPVFDFFSAVGL